MESHEPIEHAASEQITHPENVIQQIVDTFSETNNALSDIAEAVSQKVAGKSTEAQFRALATSIGIDYERAGNDINNISVES